MTRSLALDRSKGAARARRIGLSLFAAAAAACSPANTYGGGIAGHVRMTTSGLGASGAAGSGQTSSGGGTSGGTSGGAAASGTTSSATNGLQPCGFVGAHPLTDCSPGLTEVLLQVTDFCPGSSLGAIQVSDEVNPADSASSVACSGATFYYFCLDGGSVTPEVNAGGNYFPMLYPTTDPTDGGTHTDGIVVVCGAITSVVDNLPNYDPTKAQILVIADSLTGDANCADLAGWSFSLLSDGGIDAGIGFIAGTGVATVGTVTLGSGTELIYNLDPRLGHVSLVGDNPAFDDAGISCPYLGGIDFSESLRDIPLQGNFITYVPYSLP